MNKINAIYFLTFVASIFDVLSYSICIVGIKTKKLAISVALFDTLLIFCKGSMFIQATLLGSICDDAVINCHANGLEVIFRNIMFVLSTGSLIGALLTPICVEVLSKITNHFEKIGTIIKIIPYIFTNIRKLSKRCINLNDYKKLNKVTIKDIPISIIILNTIAVSLYSIGVPASIYAGALSPNNALAATQLAGIVVGISAAIPLIFVEPIIAILTDQSIEGKIPIHHVKSIIFFLVVGDIIGTIISQFLFIPLTNIIISITQWL